MGSISGDKVSSILCTPELQIIFLVSTLSLKKIICKGGIKESGHGFILIGDTGVGMDLNEAEDLFKPFVRKLKISPERQSLGLGGVGLGLTIVRMVAGAVRCNVRFVEPSNGMSTAIEIIWSSGKDENRKIKNRHSR